MNADERKKLIAQLRGEASPTGESSPSEVIEQLPMCRRCGRRVLQDSPDGLCPVCADQALFVEVRDYIRANDVTEQQVAEHFDIPQSKVKGWIRDGRITYKTGGRMVFMDNYCEVCGTPISFGSICLNCKREFARQQKHGVMIQNPSAYERDQRMRFLDDKKK